MRGIRASLAIRSAVLVTAAIALACFENKPISLDELLAEAAERAPRPVEGRLSSSWRHSPYETARASIPTPLPAALDPPEPEQRLRGASSFAASLKPQDRHTAALLALYHGQPARAVGTLERLVESTPSVTNLSDLAATYLALAEKDQSWLLLDAIEAAQRAVDLDEESPWAAFNLALALERLFLYHQADKAWTRYLEVETDAAWRADAEAHLDVIRAPTTADRWEASKEKVLADAEAGDREAVEHWAEAFPRQVKELIEDHFEAWVAAASHEPQETQAIRALRLLAESVQVTADEQLYVDAVEAIERAHRVKGAVYGDLVRAHTLYAEGRWSRDNCSIAEGNFAQAERLFRGSGGPMWLAAEYERLVCVYQRDTSAARAGLVSLERAANTVPTLHSLSLMMLALCTGNAGSTDQAIDWLGQAYEVLANIRDSRVAHAAGLIADEASARGREADAWRYRIRALKSIALSGHRRAKHNELFMLALESASRVNISVGIAISVEMVANADSWGSAAALAETSLSLAAAAHDTQDYELARSAFRKALTALKRVEGEDIRSRLQVKIDLFRGRVASIRDPSSAITYLRRALETMETTGHDGDRAKALVALGKNLEKLGRNDEAMGVYEQAIVQIESYRATTISELDRIILTNQAQAAYDSAIDLSARLGMPLKALDWLRLAQARELRARRIGSIRSASFLPLSDGLNNLASGTPIVVYAALEERLLFWLLGPDIELFTMPITRVELEQAVGSLEAAIEESAQAARIDLALERLHTLVFAPIQARLSNAETAIFVPDRALHRVPFSALRNTRTGRYLIEDLTVSISPTIDAAIHANPPFNLTRVDKVLVVGDPAFDESILRLPRLPGALQEASAVSAAYSGAELLVGTDATVDRIRRALANSSVVHIAGHVVFDPEQPLRSFLAAAPDPAAASDGRLFTNALDSSDLAKAELVFLSACETALRFPRGDREGIAGLVRPFLAAGVPRVIATLWPTDDEASLRFATSFHEALHSGATPQVALRTAAEALLRSDHASPKYWAPFQLFYG